MKRFLWTAACVWSAVAHAEKGTFSLDRLEAFNDEAVCDEKQVIAEAGLTFPCLAFWVATDGSNSNPGTKEEPFLTLQKAQAAVRALPSSAFKDQDVFVYIKEGTYRLSEPLILTSEDSGHHGHDVVYSAAPAEDPIIAGSVSVSGPWSLYDAMLGIYRTQLGASYQTRQLYVNGNRATRARTTDWPFGFLASYSGGGIEWTVTALNPPAWNNPANWQNADKIEAVILTQWKMMRVPVSSITGAGSGLITLQEPAWNNANVYYDINTGKPGEWSFFQATWFENALAFLTQPGQWYLDNSDNYLYYIPLPGEDITTADVEIPILETLIVGQGTVDAPVHNIQFNGLTFSYATWLAPSGSNGYVSDQSGQLLVGTGHQSNVIGHDPNLVPTPGNLSFTFANNITFYGNIFQHLGAVGLEFGYGSNNNTIDSNLFTDISSSAIQIGGVTPTDSHPADPRYILSHHMITNNLINSVAVEFQDAAGIFVGFTQYTTIRQNTIVDVPWSGIAMGWGWGLWDVGSFPGLPHATSGMWGFYDTPTPNLGCQILENKIVEFINVLWDGGAIYTTGQQGPTPGSGLLIQGNVAYNKRPDGGGNVIYTDGGSRYITVQSNASYNNPMGITFYNPPPSFYDPYFLQYPPYWIQNGQPYGSDTGGCQTYGQISYVGNYWLEPPLPADIVAANNQYHSLVGFYPFTGEGFMAVCPFLYNSINYPVNLEYQNNVMINSPADIPASILSNAGVQSRPPTIPASMWVLP